MWAKANWRTIGLAGLKAARRLPSPQAVQTVRSTEHLDEPTTLTASRHALGLLTPKKDGCTMSMLLARRVKVETIDELIAAGLAIKKSEVVGRGRPIEVTRIAITDAGRRALAVRATLWAWSLSQIIGPDTAWLDPLIGWVAVA